MNIKKKHHFVSQFYLRNWLPQSGKLCVWNGVDKCFFSSPQNIAYNINFYKIVNLKQQQVELFKGFSKKSGFEELPIYSLVIQSILDTEKMLSDAERLMHKIGIKRSDYNKEAFEKTDELKRFCLIILLKSCLVNMRLNLATYLRK